MVKTLHYEILDRKRKKILPKLIFLKDRFYLAGGTALALQIGHRTSIDFDYFTNKPFDNARVFREFESIFSDSRIEKTQDMKDTLSFILEPGIKFSLFNIKEKHVCPIIRAEYFNLLGELDIAAMKIIALTRAAYRDYVDLYFILKNHDLNDIISLAKKRYKNFDEGIYLKCLLSHTDVEIAPIKFMPGFKKDKKEIFSYIENHVKIYLKNKLPVS